MGATRSANFEAIAEEDRFRFDEVEEGLGGETDNRIPPGGAAELA
jgi:hypothetical protein